MKNLYFKCDKCGRKYENTYLGNVCDCGSNVYIVKFINTNPNIIPISNITDLKEPILVDVI